jgi:hypothetical protein
MNAKGSSSATVWHPAVVQAVVHEQIPFAIGALVGNCVALSEQHFSQVRPILIHGYGDPVPDGRGFRFGITLSGPWMKPVFARKGYVTSEPQDPTELQANVEAMSELMGIFNDTVLPGIVEAVNQHYNTTVLHYVDVRSVLSPHVPGEAYKKDWGNELHPTGNGFEKVAGLIHQAIVSAAPEVP